jgi:two-component system, chemotaxis family, chemotaxis protein CheY
MDRCPVMTNSIEGLTILVVDDSLQMRRLLQGMLTELGIFQVFLAKDGAEALRFLGSCDDMIDLVLCDWKMPKMNGLDLLRQIRSADPDFPFVMVTGQADEQSVVAAKNLGVTSYLVKPFSADQLLKRLRALGRLIAAGA